MSDDFRRRRRLSNTGAPSPRRSNGNGGMNPWLVTIFAAIVVIAGGWFLGQALARVFNGPPKGQTVAQAPTPLPIVTPPPSPSPAPTLEPTPTPTPAPTEKPTPAITPSVAPQPSPTPTINVIVAPTQTAAPTPAPSAISSSTPAPALTPEATAKPAPAPTRVASAGESPAAHVVRAYIDALRRGDPASASTYLGNGSPDESFIDSATHISSITSTPNGDGSYKVEVDMRTARGEYYETFTVASDRILEKTAIKP